MNELINSVKSLASQNYSCSQMQLMLSFQYNNINNPQLVAALDGLAYGIWQQETCGCLSGAACVVALYDKGNTKEEKLARGKIITDLFIWFKAEFGSTNCSDILKNYDGEMEKICPQIIAQTFIRNMENLSNSGFDLYEV